MTPQEALARIERVCAANGIDAGYFGKIILGDQNIRDRFKNASWLHPSTQRKINDALNDIGALVERHARFGHLVGIHRKKAASPEDSMARRILKGDREGLTVQEIARSSGCDENYVRKVLINQSNAGILAEDRKMRISAEQASAQLRDRQIALLRKEGRL